LACTKQESPAAREGNAVTGNTGSVTVTSEAAGVVMIDGTETGTRVKARGTVTIADIANGDTEVAVKLDDGTIARARGMVLVKTGETVTAPVPAPAVSKAEDAAAAQAPPVVEAAARQNAPVQAAPQAPAPQAAKPAAAPVPAPAAVAAKPAQPPAPQPVVAAPVDESAWEIEEIEEDTLLYKEPLIFVPAGIMISEYNGNAKNVTIPSTIGGFKVVGIGRDALYDKQLTNVTIPSSVTYIGESAFSDNQLTSIAIPSSVTIIEAYAFIHNKLTRVTIPSSVLYIGEDAFSGNQLTSVTIPSSVLGIGAGAFANNQLTSIIIPSGVTYIGRQAFANNQLTSITIPSSVTHIEYWAFEEGNNDFQDFFEDNDEKAGTYTYSAGKWTYRAN
jgi:hypothetical protein